MTEHEDIVEKLLASIKGVDSAQYEFVMATLPHVLREMQDFMNANSHDRKLCTRVVCVLITSIGCSYLAAFHDQPFDLQASTAQLMVKELMTGLNDTLMNPGRGNYIARGE